MTTKLPDAWSDFKIVETKSGTFTGQVWIDSSYKESNRENDRLLLAQYTKEYLQSLVGYSITHYLKSSDKE